MKLNYLFVGIVIFGMATSSLGIIAMRLLNAPMLFYFLVFFGGMAISITGLGASLYICHCRKNNNIMVKTCPIHKSYARE